MSRESRPARAVRYRTRAQRQKLRRTFARPRRLAGCRVCPFDSGRVPREPCLGKARRGRSTAALTAISEALGHGECDDEDLESALRSTRLCPRRGGGARRLCTRRAAVFRSAGKLAGWSCADTDARGGADSCCPRSQLSQAGTGRAAPPPRLSAKSSRERTKGHRSRKLRRLR
jgi:hypothetical protein